MFCDVNINRIYQKYFFFKHDDSYSGPPILSASAERLSRQGIYLMDNGRVSGFNNFINCIKI